MSWLPYILALLVLIHVTSSAKILAFLPLPWKSHQFVYRPLVQALARRGHQVDFYTVMAMDEPPKNLNQIVVEDPIKKYNVDVSAGKLDSDIPYRLSTMIYDLNSFILEKLMSEENAFIDLIHSNATYDLIISETAFAEEPLSYLAHRFSTPLINIVGILDYPWNNEVSGLPNNPSYMDTFIGTLTNKKSLFQRLYNFYTTESLIFSSYRETATRQQALADKYFRYQGWENRPKLVNMVSDAALVLMNSHVSISVPYPLAPHVKEVGGIHITRQTLPKDLQTFMEDAPHGIIYFSLGSLLDPDEMLAGGKADIILKVFRGLKQKVMWKVSPKMPPVHDANIKLQTWFPQQAILEHKNIVLFITHGGLQSMVESIAFGVPCVGMPGFFDQMKDVDFLVDTGMAVRLNFNNLTEESFSWAINEVLINPSYRKAAKERQKLFHDRPMKPVDEAVYWVEYVLKHGKVMQPASVHMPFYQLYLLDIYATLLLISFTFIWLCRKAVSLGFAFIFKPKNPEIKNSRKID